MLLKPREHAKTKSAACLSKKGTPSSSSSSSLGALVSLQGRRTKPRSMDRGGGSNHRHILFFIAEGGPTPSPSTILPPSRLQGYKPPSLPRPPPTVLYRWIEGEEGFFATPPLLGLPGMEWKDPRTKNTPARPIQPWAPGGKESRQKTEEAKKLEAKKPARGVLSISQKTALDYHGSYYRKR